MNVSELQAVREKIAQGWTQGFYARDARGKMTDFDGEDAVCWCLVGAACAVGARPDELATALRVSVASVWNDEPNRTQTEVLSRIDDAIARASLAEEPKP